MFSRMYLEVTLEVCSHFTKPSLRLRHLPSSVDLPLRDRRVEGTVRGYSIDILWNHKIPIVKIFETRSEYVPNQQRRVIPSVTVYLNSGFEMDHFTTQRQTSHTSPQRLPSTVDKDLDP